MSTQPRLVATGEVSSHQSSTDCWLVIGDEIWDLTDFAPLHPGGPGIITKYAGRDATQPFSEIHDQSILRENLHPSKLIGHLDTSTVDSTWTKPPPEENPKPKTTGERPPLHTLINAHDFETVAAETATRKTWAFYSSAATDLVTREANKSTFSRIFFRPRIMQNVTNISTRSRLLGNEVSSPLMCSPAAMVKLIHKDGELAIARACAKKGIIQCISTNSSFPVPQVTATAPSHPFFFQLYVNRDRAKSEQILTMLHQNPNIKAIFVTVDAATAGKREADERVKADENLSVPLSTVSAKNDSRGGGYGRVMGTYIDPALCWDDISWLRSKTHLPLLLKGVMTAADAKRAMDYGLDGIMVSNHGGRNLDTSPPSILILLELHKNCPEIFDGGMEIYIDGGIRRGTDILKCICLGAKGVSIGRSFLYAAGYGQDGVESLIDKRTQQSTNLEKKVLHEELAVAMRLTGITDLTQASPALLNTADVDHLIPGAIDSHPWIRWRPGKVVRAKL
ncbi:MAG: hypothetical protein Q9227_000843 [Pyrenula ochraceoflavens]